MLSVLQYTIVLKNQVLVIGPFLYNSLCHLKHNIRLLTD